MTSTTDTGLDSLRAGIRESRDRIDRLTAELTAETGRRDDLIRSALAADGGATDLAKDAGFKDRSRVYQIRDRRR
ncbi:hypothetical protein [Actinoplanes sp. NBRC 101535]|uniref:hypothetical protein n=1 Tax=Actinoplanes sp. NBRC 101535 TaxID=3032196 RepID=UPI00249F9814|nr:hypothetical protein [Actinoplanes sp. NBRC 101535]GLY08214.1 hypothetical protein Acsp01_85930 [Actinoplanes sp. NBRC 101535]